MNELPVEIDLAQDASSVCLALVVPKQADDAVIAAWLRRVSRAFAATEGVNEDMMHSILESQVRGFEDATHVKFVWERSVDGGNARYPQLLSNHLGLNRKLRVLN